MELLRRIFRFPESKSGQPGVPPADFLLKDAWQIGERHLIKTGDSVPLTPPEIDMVSVFEYAKGNPRYLVEDEPKLGMGGMSMVYRGWDRKLEKVVAVKRLQPGIFNEDLIELEAKTMARINHPGLPEVYDFTMAHKHGEDFPAMIMELVKGPTLRY